MKRAIFSLRALIPAVVLGLFVLPARGHAQTRVPTSLRYQFASVGLVPGESVRVTIVNLNEPSDPDAPPNPAIDPCWRVFLVDARGRRVADSGDLELPAGHTRSFTVERGKLERSEDERAGRNL